MRVRASLVLLVAAVSVAAAGCGGSSSSKPQIVTFKGPSVVSCVKKGQTKSVSFLYKTVNAVGVTPETDGQVSAQAGYNPKGGHMVFGYICPGPHKFTINAVGKNTNPKSATPVVSKSVTVVPSSGG